MLLFVVEPERDQLDQTGLPGIAEQGVHLPVYDRR